MQVLPSFDPGAAMNGNLDVSAADSGCKILLYNLSIVAIKLNFEDGSTAILHAGEANYWELDGSTPTIEWSQYSVLNAAVGPISVVTVQLYRPHEVIDGTYPFSLIYLLNLGNSVPLSTSASSVANTGNAAGTAVVTGTVLGDGNNALNITNDGQAQFGSAMNPGSVNVTGGAISGPEVDTTTVNAGTVNSTNVNVGTETVTVVLNLLRGSLKRIGKATGINTQTVTHNWGVQASAVLAYYNGAFGVAPTQALAVQSEGANSFQVVGQTGYAWTVLYIGF